MPTNEMKQSLPHVKLEILRPGHTRLSCYDSDKIVAKSVVGTALSTKSLIVGYQRFTKMFHENESVNFHKVCCDWLLLVAIVY